MVGTCAIFSRDTVIILQTSYFPYLFVQLAFKYCQNNIIIHRCLGTA